jgi:lysophospholipase L1-like esterase
MKRVLCYGDSNTWGYISGSDHLRYGNTERWPKLLQNILGCDFEIIEEGLNSRTLFTEDKRPGKEGKNGFVYLKPCIETHDKIDIIVLMLGTNELKFDFNNDTSKILDMMKKYIGFILNYRSQIDKSSIKLVLSGIPIVFENSEYSRERNKYIGARKKSEQLNILLKKYCDEENIYYIDNTDLEVGIDGVHLTKESHKILADKVSQIINKII